MQFVLNAPTYTSLPRPGHVETTYPTSIPDLVEPAHMQLRMPGAANRAAIAAGGRRQRSSPRTWCPPGSTSWRCVCLRRHYWPKRRSRRCRWACCSQLFLEKTLHVWAQQSQGHLLLEVHVPVKYPFHPMRLQAAMLGTLIHHFKAASAASLPAARELLLRSWELAGRY